MHRNRRICWVVVTAFSTLAYVPGHAVAEDGKTLGSPPSKQEKSVAIRDVQLDSAGLLHGQLVSRQNAPFADQQVKLIRQDQVIATTSTDKDGKFALRGIKGGTYLLGTMGSKTPVRLWTAGTAPPAAARGVLLVAVDRAISGNFGSQGVSNSMFRPTEGAALIAIPAVIAGAAIIQKDRQDDNELPPAS